MEDRASSRASEINIPVSLCAIHLFDRAIERCTKERSYVSAIKKRCKLSRTLPAGTYRAQPVRSHAHTLLDAYRMQMHRGRSVSRVSAMQLVNPRCVTFKLHPPFSFFFFLSFLFIHFTVSRNRRISLKKATGLEKSHLEHRKGELRRNLHLRIRTVLHTERERERERKRNGDTHFSLKSISGSTWIEPKSSSLVRFRMAGSYFVFSVGPHRRYSYRCSSELLPEHGAERNEASGASERAS